MTQNSQVKEHLGVFLLDCLGGYRERETPGSIPNPEAKPLIADNTCPCRVGNVGRCLVDQFTLYFFKPINYFYIYQSFIDFYYYSLFNYLLAWLFYNYFLLIILIYYTNSLFISQLWFMLFIFTFSSLFKKYSLVTSLAPRLFKCSVGTWQSIKSYPHSFRCLIKTA